MTKATTASGIVLGALLGSLAAGTSIQAQEPGLSFHPVHPCRVFDTRQGNQGGALVTDTPEAVGSSVIRFFTVRTLCGIPAGARAVAYNFTVVGESRPLAFRGHGVLYAADIPTPKTSNINFGSFEDIANAGMVSLAANDYPKPDPEPRDLAVKIVLADGDTPSLGTAVEVVFDVVGYFK
jgi:hypothetical protein